MAGVWLGHWPRHRNQRKDVFCSNVDVASIYLKEMEFGDELNENSVEQSFYNYNMDRGN